MSFQILKTSEARARSEALLALSQEAGVQRAKALAALKRIGGAPAFAVGYGSQRAVISGDGERVDTEAARKLLKAAAGVDEGTAAQDLAMSMSAADRAGFMADELRNAVFVGAAPLNKQVSGIGIPCGICLLVAGGGVGKTPLAHALASAGVEDYATVRIGEPLGGYSSDAHEAAASLGRALVSSANVVLDSVKDMLAESGGAAMKGGISRSALVTFSSWASLAIALGSTIYVPVNPSSSDTELLKLMIEAAKSNATMAAWNDNSGSTWEYSRRTGEGLERVSGAISFTKEGLRGMRQRSVEAVASPLPITAAAKSLSNDVFWGVESRARSA